MPPNGRLDSDFDLSIEGVGPVVQELRRARQWSQTELAEKLKVRKGLIVEVEANQRDLDFSVLLQMAEVFGITPTDFLNACYDYASRNDIPTNSSPPPANG
jgi:transcriptional regulator with XRE-family HTH domain